LDPSQSPTLTNWCKLKSVLSTTPTKAVSSEMFCATDSGCCCHLIDFCWITGPVIGQIEIRVAACVLAQVGFCASQREFAQVHDGEIMIL
jgi:hypothetical protein